MTYNEEMASILISNNLATEENIRTLWEQISGNETIGSILVKNNLLEKEVYHQLMQFMEQQGSTPPAQTQPTSPQQVSAPTMDGHAAQSQQIQPMQNMPQPSQQPTSQETKQAVPQHHVQSDDESPSLPLNFMQPRGDGDLEFVTPSKITNKSTLNQILLFARSLHATDLHITCEAPIACRVAGTIQSVTEELLSAADVERIIREGLKPDQLHELEESGDLEFVYTIQGAGRFRSTALKYRKGLSLTCRLIPMNFMSIEEIGLPASSLDLTKWAQGLVLVTGPAGCGKSTTLAALIEYINENRNEHIITIENPIENIYPKAKSQVVQREVGLHTLSQGNALRGALRQDPDILVISELRDLESIQLAVSAAETGHLVFGTMNTTDAIRTIDRLIGSFPSDEQPIIRSMISESLRGVISQKMLPSKDGKSVIPAFEVLKVTSPVSNMIRKNETHQLKSTMITGRKDGMVVFDDSLDELVKAGSITKETARKFSEDKNRFA